MSCAVKKATAVRLWDAPTRIVHWALVVLVAFAWWAAENDRLTWHRWSGYLVVGLVVFRLLWGVAGSATARFATFVKSPRVTLAYLQTLARREHPETLGHNPMGAWSVVAILGALATQTVTGLFAVDVDAMEAGPLSDRIDFDTGRLFARLHHWSFTTLQLLVLLHVAAFYLVYKRADLIGPMLTGRKVSGRDPGLWFAPPWRAVAVGLAAAAFAWWVSRGFRL
jgi:cytochrome b